MIIKRRHPATKKVNELNLDITPSQYKDWESGTHAQDAFPNLDADEREFIISGMLPGEYDQLFNEDG